MKTHWKVALTLGAAGLIGIVVPRRFWFHRSPPPTGCERDAVAASPVHGLATTHLRRGHDRLVVMAHGFLKCMNHETMVNAAEALAQRFDVLSFDFAGHGLSEGTADLDFERAADELEAVLRRAHAMGYRRVAVVGYSMGAAAAVIAAARGTPMDALAAVSCPAGRRNGPGIQRQATTGWAWWARLMGSRVAPVLRAPTWPIEYVADVSPVPLLIVHDEWDVLVTREDAEALYAVARPPKTLHLVPNAPHAWPMASIAVVGDWLDDVLAGG